MRGCGDAEEADLKKKEKKKISAGLSGGFGQAAIKIKINQNPAKQKNPKKL